MLQHRLAGENGQLPFLQQGVGAWSVGRELTPPARLPSRPCTCRPAHSLPAHLHILVQQRADRLQAHLKHRLWVLIAIKFQLPTRVLVACTPPQHTCHGQASGTHPCRGPFNQAWAADTSKPAPPPTHPTHTPPAPTAPRTQREVDGGGGHDDVLGLQIHLQGRTAPAADMGMRKAGRAGATAHAACDAQPARGMTWSTQGGSMCSCLWCRWGGRATHDEMTNDACSTRGGSHKLAGGCERGLQHTMPSGDCRLARSWGVGCL